MDESNDYKILGGLRLSNGCQVLHVPSYLKGLWESCKTRFPHRTEWNILAEEDKKIISMDPSRSLQEHFDTAVYCAGAGLWQDDILRKEMQSSLSSLLPRVTLVRGQSLELDLEGNDDKKCPSVHPVLCGKYASPTTKRNHVLVGATREYNAPPLSPEQVYEELQNDEFSNAIPHIWKHVKGVDRITSGIRVQTQRGNLGRLPIVGQIMRADDDTDGSSSSAWIFTGLGSRGLLHHGIYGDVLSDAILAGDGDEPMFEQYPHLAWWKKKQKRE
eukprot:CAMPEP_0116838362 /NCGR_PEP_ID=MMETSP0418-20121206/9175_1 /TAXON_ID=1158023 /ORGANISM="Astrosyne radiata, Strain 13vi08-1A" /LENGTH=272 /DNA_ID=CAMNT_0004468365 /DNA_START=319 /DNA_END=1137 /DNA_ORIENTATION=-